METLDLLQEILAATKENNYVFKYQNGTISDQPIYVSKILYPVAGRVALFYDLVEGEAKVFAVEYTTETHLSIYSPIYELLGILPYPVTGLLYKYKELAVTRYLGSIPKTALPESIPLKNDCSFNPLLSNQLISPISNLISNQATLE